jgi:hypothetical protein
LNRFEDVRNSLLSKGFSLEDAELVAGSYDRNQAKLSAARRTYEEAQALSTARKAAPVLKTPEVAPPSARELQQQVNTLAGANPKAAAMKVLTVLKHVPTRDLHSEFISAWGHAIAALEPHREYLGAYYRLLLGLLACRRVMMPEANPRAAVPFMIPRAALGEALGLSVSTVDHLLGGVYGIRGVSLKNVAPETRAMLKSEFARFAAHQGWTCEVSSNCTKGTRRLHAGTLFMVREIPTQDNGVVFLPRETLEETYRDLESDIISDQTYAALQSDTSEKRQPSPRGICKESLTPKKEELKILIHFLQKAMSRPAKHPKRSIDSLQTASKSIFDVRNALDTKCGRGHAGREVWTLTLGETIAAALGESGSRQAVRGWTRAAWIILKLRTFGLETAAFQAEQTLYTALTDVLIWSKDNARIKNRGAVARTLMDNPAKRRWDGDALPAWEQFEAMAASLHAGRAKA